MVRGPGTGRNRWGSCLEKREVGKGSPSPPAGDSCLPNCTENQRTWKTGDATPEAQLFLFRAAWRSMEGGSLGQSSGGDGLWRMNSVDTIGSTLKELLVARMAEREVEP